MPAYVPPHLRNQIIQENEQPASSGNSAPTSNGHSNDRSFRSGGPRPSRSFGNRFGRGSSEDRNGGSGRKLGGRWKGGLGPDNSSDSLREEELFQNAMNTGINFDKYDNIPVSAKGREVPPGIDNFNESGLHPKLLRNIERAKFEKPTPVQKHSIPMAIAKRDIMACAQTGSGKTGGFLFPIIQTLLDSGVATNGPSPSHSRGPFYSDRNRAVTPDALVLSPTRELTTQIFEESRKFTFQTGLKTVVVYGGAPINRQINALQRGCNILVATPGRLVDLIDRGYVSLEKIQFFVLDEADRMLDMGFEDQIRAIVDECDMPLKGERQTMMFSATFPKEIQSLAASFLEDYIFLTVGRVGSTTDMITQNVLYVDDQDKMDALLDSIKVQEGLALVFTKTKRDCDSVENELRYHGIDAASIHGDRSQFDRERALKDFKYGRASVLVATDVASRGLDIPNVTHVINFDMPENIDSYIHRIGRTGRAGNEGLATSFYNHANSMVIHDLVDTLQDTNQNVPDWIREEKARHGRVKNMKKRQSRYSSRSGGRGGGYGRRNGGGFGGGFRSQSRWGGNSNWGT